MCTVVISVEPSSPAPVLLAGVRDEFARRAWLPPARHWPEFGQLVGGLDTLAGGTWLTVDPQRRRVAAILNAFGGHVDGPQRLSRGELPLRRAAGTALAALPLHRYDPFHLVYADLDTATVSTWDGASLVEQTLGSGLHLIVNSGVEGRGAGGAPAEAAREMAARLAHFRPKLLAAKRPEPGDGSSAQAWGQWLPIVDGDGLDPADPRAMVLRRDFADRGIWGTSSISLVALRPGGVRYDFTAEPGAAGSYLRVPLGG